MCYLKLRLDVLVVSFKSQTYYILVDFTACAPPLFEEFIDSSVSGGVAQSEISTLEQCQGQCAAVWH